MIMSVAALKKIPFHRLKYVLSCVPCLTQVAALTEVTLTQTAEIFRLNELVMQMDHELQQGNTEGGANLSHQLERSMSL
jgi:hypothetical protein